MNKRQFKTYSVRPYHGYDCDSEMGFNNGCYLTQITVRAESPESACVRAMALWRRNQGNYSLLKAARAHDSWFYNSGDGQGFYVEGPYLDHDGNELSANQVAEMDGESYHYRYEYVDFHDAEECAEVGNE